MITSHGVYSKITTVEEELKELCSQDVAQTFDSQVLKEAIIDFLHRLKDKHPSSTSLLFANFFLFYYSSKTKPFDVAHRVMKFMWDNKLKPSAALIEEYRQSKTTKTLNLFPSKKDWKKIGMEVGRYEGLKKGIQKQNNYK